MISKLSEFFLLGYILYYVSREKFEKSGSVALNKLHFFIRLATLHTTKKHGMGGIESFIVQLKEYFRTKKA